MDFRDRFHSLLVLFDFKMRIRHSRDLRKVGNTENLMVSSDHRHFFGHFLSGPSADACINFIKDQRFYLISVRQDRFQDKHDPGKFSSGNDFRQRLHIFSRICRNFIFDIIIPIIGKFLFLLEADTEFHIQEIQIPETFQNFF